MHFYTTNGSMVGSYVQSNQNLSLYAVGNTTSSASSTLLNASNLSFSGMGVASVGMSAGAVIISVPAGGGGLTNINVSAGTTSQNLSNIVFADSNGLSFGLNGSTVTANPITLSGWDPLGVGQFQGELVTAAGLYATCFFAPASAPNLQFDRVVIPIFNTNSSNSSGSHTISAYIGIFTKNGNTMSLLASASSSTGLTHSGTAGSYSLYSDRRLLTVPFTTSLSQSNYFVGVMLRTSSAGANGSYSLFIRSVQTYANHAIFGQSSNNSYQNIPGVGVHTVSTAAMPNSVAFSDINGRAASGQKPPAFWFLNGTVA